MRQLSNHVGNSNRESGNHTQEEGVECARLGGASVVVDCSCVNWLRLAVIAAAFGVCLIAGPLPLEELQLRGGNGLWVVDHVPLHDLGAGGRRQRALVVEQLSLVQSAEEGLSVGGSGRPHGRVGSAVAILAADKGCEEVVVGNAACALVEDDADDREGGSVSVGVDDVHLQVVVLTVEGVLGGRVEVELQRVVAFPHLRLVEQVHVPVRVVVSHQHRVCDVLHLGLNVFTVVVLDAQAGDCLPGSRLTGAADVGTADWIGGGSVAFLGEVLARGGQGEVDGTLLAALLILFDLLEL